MSKDFRGESVHNLLNVSKLTSLKTHKELEKIGLYRGQPPLLFALWQKDELSGRVLAASLGIQPATVTKMVQRLKRKGFVTNKQDPLDARVSKVCLTEKGRAIEFEVRQVYEEIYHEIFQGFNEKQMVEFERSLSLMRDNIRSISGEAGRNND